MIPEIGHFSLIIAFILAFISSMIPVCAFIQKETDILKVARPLSLGQLFFILIAFISLAFAFVNNDFSVLYVFEHSNSNLPLIYKWTSIWAGHEGSILLWALIHTVWMVAFMIQSRHLPLTFVAKVLSVMSCLSFGFLLFLLMNSNPFSRLLPNYPLEGNDLNPLLQDPGLIMHPPILYIGYVGMALPFAFAMTTLWLGRVIPLSIPILKSFVLLAWGFLTIGIALGSFWAYYELGWGGWWFWDPVENASFIPWLLGIALLHCLKVSEEKKVFYGWVLFLSIAVFCLSLLGTFLVRSGMVTSVHAFASDPSRGLFLLQFLFLIVGLSLILYLLRGPKLFNRITMSLYSRETLILLNILILMVAAGSILLGTLYPILIDGLTGQKISVGFPYFNAVFIPLMLPLLLLMPFGKILHWGQTAVFILKSYVITFIVSFGLAAFIFGIILDFKIFVFLGCGISFWIILATLNSIKLKHLKLKSIHHYGMHMAHIGVAITVLGIVIVSHYQIEKDIQMSIGSSSKLANNTVTFEAVERNEGSNFVGYRARFCITNNTQKTILYPEKRIFVEQGNVMTETAIDPGFFRDIYISLGEKLQNNTWTLRLYYKPFVRWIWLGAIFMAMGAFMVALKKKQKQEER